MKVSATDNLISLIGYEVRSATEVLCRPVLIVHRCVDVNFSLLLLFLIVCFTANSEVVKVNDLLWWLVAEDLTFFALTLLGHWLRCLLEEMECLSLVFYSQKIESTSDCDM